LGIGGTKMNSDKARFYKKFAYILKRRYPLLKIYLDIDSGFLRRIVEPKYLYLTKSNNQFNAIFTYRRYENITEIGLNKFNPKDHELLLDSFIYHDKAEIDKSLLPYFPELHFSKIIHSKINKDRCLYDDDGNLLENKDEDLFGSDLIKFINITLLQSSLKIHSPEENFYEITESDLEAYGTDMFDMINFLSKYSYAIDSDLESKKVIIDLNDEWGEELIELIIKRASSYHYYVKDHFLQWRMDSYLDGEDKMLWLLKY
jgi:hypothetical protein